MQDTEYEESWPEQMVWLSWQPWLWRDSPWHGRPPNLAGGLLHSLFLTDTPTHASHSDHSLHNPHEPWTRKERDIHKQSGPSTYLTRKPYLKNSKIILKSMLRFLVSKLYITWEQPELRAKVRVDLSIGSEVLIRNSCKLKSENANFLATQTFVHIG